MGTGEASGTRCPTPNGQNRVYCPPASLTLHRFRKGEAMSGREEPSGPQFLADRPAEQPAVRTTIVGGRPPGSGQPIGNIPRGMEVLLKKAAVDPEFKELLLRDRAAAADTIGLTLEPAEAMMLAATPADQLEAIIAETVVPEQHRRVFLGKTAAAMLIAIGRCGTDARAVAVRGPRPDDRRRRGSRPPERPDRVEPSQGIRHPPRSRQRRLTSRRRGRPTRGQPPG